MTRIRKDTILVGLLISIAALACLSLAGCQVQYVQTGPLPETPEELRTFIAEYEAKVESEESLIADAKESRDALVEASKGASWVEDYSGKISRANTRINFANHRLSVYKQQLAEARAQLEGLEREDSKVRSEN